MDQKVMQLLLILMFYPNIPSAADIKDVKEGDDVTIKCEPTKEKVNIVFWFRVVNNSQMELIGSFAPNTGQLKIGGPSYQKNLFVSKSGEAFVLSVKSFNKREDSGTYTCASLVSGNTLSFGPVTVLQEKKEAALEKATAPPAIQVSSTAQTSTTPKSCFCNDRSGPSMFCAPIILGPLAGGCGLLLLLLIITILYCNKIRTRRCPHHYKKKLRTMAPEKQMMTNRHI